jgi:pyruvate formate lyase activating enzyme
MSTAIIFDLKKYSIHDGPGIRTTVFFKGCPLRCWWCHNPESQSPRVEVILRPSRCIRCGACLENCPHGAISWDGEAPVTDRAICQQCGECTESCYAEARQVVGREMTLEEVLAEIETDRPFYESSGGGVTLSGGEPLFQPEFVRQLLQTCQERDIHTALDTCGFAPWEKVDSLRRYVDLFLYDLKLVDEDAHRRFTGTSNRLILSNLQRLSELGHAIRLRVPLIPGVNDDPASLEAIARLAAGLPLLQGLDLLPYHSLGADKYARLDKPYPLAEATNYDQERLEEVAYFIESHGLLVNIGG